MLLMPSRERTRRIKYHRVCTTWYLFSFYFASNAAAFRWDVEWWRENDSWAVQKFCIKKHHNFHISAKGKKCLIDEWRIIDFLECTIRRENQEGDKLERGSRLNFILIRSPGSLFLCNANGFFYSLKEKTVSISIGTAQKAGIIRSVMHLQSACFGCLSTSQYHSHPLAHTMLPFVY